MNEDVQTYIDQAMALVSVYGWSLLGAALILIIGFWLARISKSLTKRALERTGKIDPTITSFLSSAVRYIIIIFTIMAVLDQFGVETTSIVALLGAAGLAVGLALQGTLSNVAAGVMLLFFRPFKVGDFVDAGGQSGTIESIGLFNCHMNKADNVHIIVPNSQIWGSAITNYNTNPTRRIDIPVGIGYNADMDKALNVATKAISADERVMKDPAPTLAIGNLGESSVDLIVRAWCKREDYWAVRWDLTKAIKEAFDREGISIPYPHRTLEVFHMDKK